MIDIVVAAATVLLGERVLAAHAQDVERIVQVGRLPLTMPLIEGRGRNVFRWRAPRSRSKL